MTTAVVAAGDGLPAFLPTAPPQSSAASSTTSGEIENAMEQLSVQNTTAQSPSAHHQPHPLPPRPHAPRAFPHPQMFPSGDIATPFGDHSQPLWTAAYPLPPVFAQPLGSLVSLDALGLVHGPPGPRPMQPMYLPPPPTFAQVPIPPRPHPFLSQPILYVSFVPSDMVGEDFEQPLIRQGVSPVAIRLPDAVKPLNRGYPDSYYNWMTKNGCLQFASLHDTEKALSILVSHPYFGSKNVLVSPLPPPNVSPLPPAPVAPRFIRPVKLANPQMSTAYPQPGQLWDFVRPWGSIREVSVTLEESQVQGTPSGQGECRWRAKVQFWYEEEAHRFESSFLNAGPFAGWEIEVRRDPSYIPMAPLPFQQPMAPFAPHPMGPPFAPMHHSPPPMIPRQFSPPMISQQMLPPDGAMFPHMVMPMHPEAPFMYPTPDAFVTRSLPMMPDVIVSPNGVITPLSPVSPVPILAGPPSHSSELSIDNTQAMGIAYVQHPGHFVPGSGERMPPGAINVVRPPSPPNVPVPRYVAPWAAQNSGAALPISPPYLHSESLPQGSPQPQPHHSMESRGPWNTGKNWQEVSGGFISEDGHVVQHVHNRPPHSPKKGGRIGSFNSSLDFCTLIVKNLAPDVNAIFLGDQFSRFGKIASIRIMRDQTLRPRGFGFVQFQLPEDAASALTHMNGAELAGRHIVLAYKERRYHNNNNNNRGFPGSRGRGGGNSRYGSGMRHDWSVKDSEAERSNRTENRSIRTDAPIPRALVAAAPQVAAKPPSYGAVSAPSRLQPNVTASDDAHRGSVAYDEVTLDTLAVMPPSAAFGTLSGGGSDLLRKLDLKKQVTTSHLEQSPGSKKLAIISSVNKVLHHGPVHGLSPSRVVACVRDFVNGLDQKDEESLTELLNYPAVISAMILHRLKSPRPGYKALPA